MKAITIILLMPIFCLGQITGAKVYSEQSVRIGEVKEYSQMIAALKYTAVENDTFYTFSYLNKHYSHITDTQVIVFSGAKTLDDLYKFFKSFYLPENENNKDYGMSFKLGDHDINMFANKGKVFFSEGNNYTVLTEKQIDKLFGRK